MTNRFYNGHNEERLSDLPRPGSPCKITPEQWCKIMAVCFTAPQEYGYPITHWSGHELVKEVVKQGIVESISVSHLNDFFPGV
jgi:putative transposase